MAAISNMLFALLKSGDNLITTKYLFGNTLSLFQTLLSDFGVEVRYVDLNNLEEIKANIDAKTRLLFCESVSNPHLIVPDFTAIKSLLAENNVPFIVDTTATPWNLFDAKKHGVDVRSSRTYTSSGDRLGGLIVDEWTYNWTSMQPYTLYPHWPNALTYAFAKRYATLGNALASKCYVLSLGLETMDACKRSVKMPSRGKTSSNN